MKNQLLALVICGVALSAEAFAEDKVQGPKKDTVEELDATGIARVLERGDVNKPTAITSAEELARAIPAKEVQTRLQKTVDFTKQQILFFAWSGSGGDKLTYRLDKGATGPVVIFEYQRGLQKNLVAHVRLFAIPRNATWKVQPAR
jgi:hypothetical protein